MADPDRNFPAGVPLARLLARFNARLGRDVLGRIQRTRGRLREISLAGWAQTLAEIVEVALLPLYRQGAQHSLRGLARRRSRKGMTTGLSATPPQPGPLATALDLFNRLVLDAVRGGALVLAQSTLDTAAGEVTAALAETRAQLAAGLEEGETLASLSRRVGRIFLDPVRAQRAAVTEASRAVHAGQVLLAKQTDGLIARKRWLASGDACPECLALDGKVVGLDEPFVVQGSGPYAAVMHPPLHPHCFCALEDVLDL